MAAVSSVNPASPANVAKVTVIPAKKDRIPINVLRNEETKSLRVAAYARVSTNNEEQVSSYEAQVDYYTNYIQSKDEWEFIKVYTDGDTAYGLIPKRL